MCFVRNFRVDDLSTCVGKRGMKASVIVVPHYWIPGVESLLLLSFSQEPQQVRDALFMSPFFTFSQWHGV